MEKLKDFSELAPLLEQMYEEQEFSIERDPLSSAEIKFYQKMGILVNKLKRKGISPAWDDEAEVLVVCKKRIGTVCPTYMYLAVYEDGRYAFGGEETDLVVSTKAQEVVDAAVEWLNNQEPAVR